MQGKTGTRSGINSAEISFLLSALRWVLSPELPRFLLLPLPLRSTELTDFTLALSVLCQKNELKIASQGAFWMVFSVPSKEEMFLLKNVIYFTCFHPEFIHGPLAASWVANTQKVWYYLHLRFTSFPPKAFPFSPAVVWSQQNPLNPFSPAELTSLSVMSASGKRALVCDTSEMPPALHRSNDKAVI